MFYILLILLPRENFVHFSNNSILPNTTFILTHSVKTDEIMRLVYINTNILSLFFIGFKPDTQQDINFILKLNV